MSKKHISLFFAGLFFSSLSVAQNIVSVNPSTGTANVVIPIYTLTSGQIAVPISISYSATGVKTRDMEGSAGMNWELNAGGSINRVCRGLPDDVTQDNSGASVYGWMLPANSGAAYAAGFNIQNDDSTCSKGQTDITSINTYIPYKYDTEPDLFYVNAPGLSMEMVWDRANGGAFHPVNYQDVSIAYSLVGGTGYNQDQLASFTITNDKGWVYNFAAPETVTEKTYGSPTYLTTKYNQYKNGITYYDSWNLMSITDANGNAVTMAYNTGLVRNSTDSVNLYLAGATTKTYQYLVSETVTPQVLYTMSSTNLNTSNQRLLFGFNYPGEVSQTGQTVVTNITGMGHGWYFNYSPASYDGHYTRAFLTGFIDGSGAGDPCTTPVYYLFNYNGVYNSLNTTILPDSTSTQVDYWGYYSSTATGTTLQPYVYVNPTAAPRTTAYPRYLIAASGTAGSGYSFHAGEHRRAVSASSIADGSLSEIVYPQGGSTTLLYEPNNYYDPTVNANVAGGGIRIKQIIDSTGSGAANRIVRNYTYVNPGTTQSSGVPITLPQFAFTIPYSGSGTGQTLWTDASAQSDYDLSTDDHTILYAYTTLSQFGAGQTVYNNTTTGNCWQAVSAPSCSGCANEWLPTLNYAASYACPSTSGPITNLLYSYPFIPNPNYDFERGLPISVTNNNDAGTPVSVTNYTYSRSYPAPSTILAFKAEDGPTGIAKFYNQYIVYYGTSELTASVTKTVYDNLTQSQAQTSLVNYYYLSPNHKLMTQTKATNSDNSIVNTYFYYIKDYASAASANANINALYYLKQANVNAPVETYQTVTRSGTTLTTSAALTLFSASTNGTVTHYLPSQQYKLTQPNGETSTFSKFTINTAGAGSTSMDPGYYPAANFDTYDNTAYPETVDDAHKRIATSLQDFLSGKPTAVFKNAAAAEVAFQDFDSQFAPSVNTFTIGGSGTFAPVGSHAGNAAGLAMGQSIASGTITKNTSAVNYIFSFWLNVSGTTTLTFTGAAITPPTYTVPGWTYHEFSIPASSLGSTFSLGFSASANVSVDDLLIYPDVSEATTATYDQSSYYKICQTNTNGVSAYFANDQWGRVLYAYDQDHNIVQRNQYFPQHSFAGGYSPGIIVPSPLYAGIAATFGITGPACYSNSLSASWKFGDGPDYFNSGTHTYATAGTYTVIVKVTSPVWGTFADTTSVTVTNLPATNITYLNACTPGGHIPSAILQVVFTPIGPGGTTYTFTTAELEAGASVVPGNYTIQIYPIGTQYNPTFNPTGWGAIQYSGPSSPNCWNFIAAGGYITTTSNLTYTPTVQFEIQPGSCMP